MKEEFISLEEKEKKEHFEEYGKMLDTLFVEDVIMPKVIDLIKKDSEKEKLQNIFDYFEDVSNNADEYLLNVFSVTTLEILGNEAEVLKKSKQYMGSVTAKLQREADLDLGRNV